MRHAASTEGTPRDGWLGHGHSLRRRGTFLFGVAVTLTSCSFQPKYVRPAAPIPTQWSTSVPLDSTVAAAPTISYEDVFGDSALQQIIQQGLTYNRDLRIAMANVASVRAQYRIQRSEFLPTITGSAGATYGQNGSNQQSAFGQPGARIEQYSVGLGLSSLEIDLFGRLRSLSAAALNDYFASEAGAQVAWLTLVSSIASAYYTLAADRSRMTITQETEKNALRALELAEARYRGGIASMLDVYQAQTILSQARADIAGLTTRIEQDRNALQLLVGAPIDDRLLPQSIESVDRWLTVPPMTASTNMLLRRPDIARAEYQLRAANARIGAARAALFPKLSLSALLNWTGGTASRVFDGSPGWNAQPGLTATIFDAGLPGAVSFTQAQRELFLAQYERTIQTAFREVADALARQETITAELDANTARVEAANASYNLSYARYRGGLDAFLVTLDAQRQLYAAQLVLITSRFARADNIVALYRTIAADTSVIRRSYGKRQ